MHILVEEAPLAWASSSFQDDATLSQLPLREFSFGDNLRTPGRICRSLVEFFLCPCRCSPCEPNCPPYLRARDRSPCNREEAGHRNPRTDHPLQSQHTLLRGPCFSCCFLSICAFHIACRSLARGITYVKIGLEGRIRTCDLTVPSRPL